MLYGRRLDDSLDHVQGSRYALVHAVSKRARQITLWLTADPAELRAEAAPPPAPGELVSRDPVALAEAEIIDGEIAVRWNPDGALDKPDPLDAVVETDPLLIDGLDDDVIGDVEGGADDDAVTPALAQVLEADEAVEAAEETVAEDDADPADAGEVAGGKLEVEGGEGGDVSLEEAAKEELEAAEEEDELG